MQKNTYPRTFLPHHIFDYIKPYQTVSNQTKKISQMQACRCIYCRMRPRVALPVLATLSLPSNTQESNRFWMWITHVGENGSLGMYVTNATTSKLSFTLHERLESAFVCVWHWHKHRSRPRWQGSVFHRSDRQRESLL